MQRIIEIAAKENFHNQKGIALITALMLSLIGMMLIASLLLFVNNGTWLSGSKKRYQADLEAAHGGMNFFAKEIIQRGLAGDGLSAMGSYYPGFMTQDISDTDFDTKLHTDGISGGGLGYPSGTVDLTVTIKLQASPSVAVSAGIISTGVGNSSNSSKNLLVGGVIDNNFGNTVPHIPYLYQLKIHGQSGSQSKENAQISSVYVY